MPSSRAVACCLLNISEARNAAVVDRVARAAIARPLHPPKVETTILNIFRDHDYNRSVITLASSSTIALKQSVVDACKEAFASIDLRHHVGGHPRLGAVDLIPIHPLCSQLSVNDCGEMALEIATRLSQEVDGSSFFLFGNGEIIDSSKNVTQRLSLVQRRRQVGWFSSGGLSTPPTFPAHLSPDVGLLPNERLGLTGVGAMPYMMNFNVTISTTDAQVGKTAADAVREATGGFRGVRAMAFPHEGNVEVACNVEAVELTDDSGREGMVAMGDGGNGYYHAAPEAIRQRIVEFLEGYNKDNGTDVKVMDGSTIIGFSPSEMADVAAEALSDGDSMYFLRKMKRMM